MPGSRLTRQERQDIAAGLAGGLSYTEIAKSLHRPTSTITREVLRNGGPAEYRAGRAHHATEQRAQRSRRAGSRKSPDSAPATAAPGRDEEALRDFEQRLAELSVGMGMPRMMAAVLACLYTTDSGSLTTADLVRHLRVSPASISKATVYLEGQDLLRRERDGRHRHYRYVIDDGLWYRAMLSSIRLNGALAEAAREGAGLLGADTPAGCRLEELSQVLELLDHHLLRSIEEWRHIRSAGRTPRTVGVGGLTGAR
ncbi:MarR family transcriptional regulator [Streptomyces rectiverticillatus]|uniref:GbsR/MarR family transcriptional regulator n=1 Tax=Streptomyces rectiverticillatus TaxID=173860 RepID=UPI0015C34C12|nr:helix-turn-helix domain-containing protein [Streptomyces rectiverticillatus]QLE70454.1 MarR family transcriptional regulator [Streptomyces rectiverticillatus]